MPEKDPKKQQMEYIAVGLVVVVAVFIGLSRFKKKEKDDEVFSKKEFNEKWKEVEILEKKVPEEEKGISYTADAERIPFKSPFEEERVDVADENITLPAMTFQGMVWNSMRPQVIVDNKVYDIHDSIEIGIGDTRVKVKIKDITKDGIYLEYKRKKFLVRPK